MMVRSWFVAAFSLGTLAAWTPSTPLASKQYRVDLKTSVTQDLTAVGQGQQKLEYTTAAFVTLSTADSAGGQSLKLVLDSLVPGEGAPIPPDAAKGAAGLTWHGFRQASGKVGALTLEGDSQIGGMVEPALRQLIPPMKPGTREGQQWTDTTDADNNGVSVRTVTNFQTTSETFNGAKVTRLAGAFSSAMSGTQQSAQGTLNLEGNGSGTITWLIGADGLMVSATNSANQNISVSVATLPEPIPVTVKTEGTASLLK
jgi:hypothetical protein